MDKYPIYLDCNATTPLEKAVREKIIFYFSEEFGNAGSRTHLWGEQANKAVIKARQQIANTVATENNEVIFTSGATESNNLALLGLRQLAEKTGKKHIITTPIEHKAVLEPLKHLENQGFEITFAEIDNKGWVDPDEIKKHLRKDTLAISVMQVNNETGVLQPLDEICNVLADHEAIFHTDAAQGFGKEMELLKNKRLDLISISGHKIFAPKGIGALIIRKRGYKKLPLTPLMFGGGQERGLRPGTIPVPLVVGLGEAAELAMKDWKRRKDKCQAIRKEALKELLAAEGVINGDENKIMPHILNISFPGIDSEAAIITLKDLVAISNGSACSSQSYTPSHVLTAMKLDEDRINSALRFSWCHLTPQVDWHEITKRIKSLY